MDMVAILVMWPLLFIIIFPLKDSQYEIWVQLA